MSEHPSEPVDTWRAELSAARAAGDTAEVRRILRLLQRLREPANVLAPRDTETREG